MKTIKKPIALALALIITMGSSTTFAASVLPAATDTSAPPATVVPNNASNITANGQKAAYLREDVTVEFNREVLTFKDEGGNEVFPITYNNSTYLPIRAVSGLMCEPIEWSGRAKTVYIGKTISHPVKMLLNDKESPYVEYVSPEAISTGAIVVGGGERSIVGVREQKNVLVMYDFEIIEFKNESGERIYPINYNGSNYLPLRSIAELMDEEIVWDGKTRTVFIGSLVPIEEEPVQEVRDETLALKALYDKEAEIYNLATANIAAIGTWTPQNAPIMAAAISEKLEEAKVATLEAASLLETDSFTEAEEEAAIKLSEFALITEYYITVMENIAYLAVQGEDYSMLAETFLDYALATDKAMENARSAIEALE